MQAKSRRRWALGYRVVYALLGLALAILQALVVTKVIQVNPWVPVYIAGTLGLLAFVDNMRTASIRYRAPERNAARARMHKPLIATLYAITEAREVALPALGASVFIPRAHWSRRWVVVPRRSKRLIRVVRARISEHPQESEIEWTEGKGTIGECWEKRTPAHHDRRKVAAQYGDGSRPTESEFAGLDQSVHTGFTLTEFNQMIDKYGEIRALPICARNSGAFLGVVSIDVTADAYADAECPALLKGRDIEAFASRASALIRDDLAKF